jgi:methylated-DNA-[protein]-cysteine S-methyltransferase
LIRENGREENMKRPGNPLLYTRQTAIGCIGLAERDGALVELAFQAKPGAEHVSEPEVIRRAFAQIEEYLAGRRKNFHIPLHVEGTPFMRRVWDELCKIPYGATRSYKDIAVAIGRPGAMRAVGMANNRNPIALIIPCHRVIGADGRLVGFGGGLDVKRRLLELEAGGAHLPVRQA